MRQPQRKWQQPSSGEHAVEPRRDTVPEVVAERSAVPPRGAPRDPGGMPGLRTSITRARQPSRAQLLLGLQRAQGNRYVQRLVHDFAQRDAAPNDVSEPADRAAATRKAIQLVNKNSMVKLKVPMKPPANVRLWHDLELKKLEIECDVTAELDLPSLGGGGALTKVAGGAQNTAVSEVDAKKASLTETQATVYALELQEQGPAVIPGAIGKALSFKAGAEYGAYYADNALSPSKQEAKGKVAIALDTDIVSGEFSFTPLAYDSAKQGAAAFKLATATVKIGTGRMLEVKLPGLLRMLDNIVIDVKARVKISGSVDIGPNLEAFAETVAKRLGKEGAKQLAEAATPQLIEEEGRRWAKRYAEEVVAYECRLIADPAQREATEAIARRKVEDEIAARLFEQKVAEQSSFFIRREMQEAAARAAPVDIFALRSMVIDVVERVAPAVAGELGPALRMMAREAVAKLSMRGIATNVAKAMAGGPADFVLIGVETLMHIYETAVIDLDLKEIPLIAQASRDNYVAGYAKALKGDVSGEGQSGGADNVPGTALLLGAQEGRQQFNAVVDQHVALHPGAQRPQVVEDVQAILAGTPINTALIGGKAAPKLRELLLAAYEKQHTGFLDRLIGNDIKGTQDYQTFAHTLDRNLNSSAVHVEPVTLANGVHVALVMLDTTDFRAQVFRTQDGRYLVRFAGDTRTHSGFITDEGTPLEDIYRNQDSADMSAGTEAGVERVAAQRRQLAACALLLVVTFRDDQQPHVIQSRLSGKPSDPRFDEFLRSAGAQALTVAESSVTVTMEGSFKHDGTARDYSITAEGESIRRTWIAGADDGRAWRDSAEPWRTDATTALATLYRTHVASMLLASMSGLY